MEKINCSNEEKVFLEDILAVLHLIVLVFPEVHLAPFN